MVQVISLLDTKDLKPQKTSIKVDTDVDFLELLMNDIKVNKGIDDKDNEIVELNEPKLKEFSKDAEKKEESKDNLNEVDVEIDTKQKVEIKNLELFLNQQSINKDEQKVKDLVVKEVKNIIDSKMKQKNILLTKSEIKEFKNIDNIKDLIKFADKKGLNIENIKVEVPKEFDIQNKMIDDKVLKSQFDKKNNLSTDEFISHKKNIVNISKNSTEEKEIKPLQLEDILQNKDKKIETKTKNDLKKQIKKDTEEKEIKISDSKKEVQNKKFQIQNQKTREATKEQNIDLNEENKEFKQVKKLKEETTSEIKIQNTQKESKKIDLTTLLKNPKIDKSTHEIKSNIEMKEIKHEKVVEPKVENLVNNNQLNNVNEIKIKSIQAKQTIDSFKNNLDEAIKNYKPPVSKVNIELNPQNLGKVEVTIIQRGNNIQVNMNTDQNNVVLFQQHQAEFRQALSSIGFSNIDMSFNSNQDRDRRQNQAKKTYKDNETIEELGEIEIKADYKYA